MSIFRNLRLSRLTREQITKNFSQRLIARMASKIYEGTDYLSTYDLRAIQQLRNCHPQDTGDVDLETIALDEFYSLNPSYKLEE